MNISPRASGVVTAQPHITADNGDKALTPIMGWSQDPTL